MVKFFNIFKCFYPIFICFMRVDFKYFVSNLLYYLSIRLQYCVKFTLEIIDKSIIKRSLESCRTFICFICFNPTPQTSCNQSIMFH